MLVSGGKVIAIDYIKTNSATLSGDGVWTELGLNTSATIDPIKNDISSLSSTITNISGDLYNLSGDVVNISGDLYNLSGDVYNISSNVNTISGDVDALKTEVSTISSDLETAKTDISTISGNLEETKEIVNELTDKVDKLENTVETLSSTVDEHTENIETLLGDVNYLSAELDEETSARLYDYEILDGKINQVSADLDDEIYYREFIDNELSAAIDTKQKQLSAGQYVELVENDDYDTINITGINPSTFFTAQMNRRSSSEYFTFDGHTLSASDKIGYFNLSIGYKVSTTETCVDNYYESTIKVNDTIVDTHYIEGAKPCENHYISQNILNDADNYTYDFSIEKDNELNVSDMNITCIGFIGSADDISLGVLGANGGILTFGNTILRV